MMEVLNALIVSVFCLVDELLDGKRLRQRGPSPELSDSELITMEMVGEFLGMDTDKAIYLYFKRHYAEWFPKLEELQRTPPSALRLCPQALPSGGQPLEGLKERVRLDLLEHEPLLARGAQEPLLVVHPFPMPLCKKSRSYKCKVMRALAHRGGDTDLGKSLGMRAHVPIARAGMIVGPRRCAGPTSTTPTRPRDSFRGWEGGGSWCGGGGPLPRGTR